MTTPTPNLHPLPSHPNPGVGQNMACSPYLAHQLVPSSLPAAAKTLRSEGFAPCPLAAVALHGEGRQLEEWDSSSVHCIMQHPMWVKLPAVTVQGLHSTNMKL